MAPAEVMKDFWSLIFFIKKNLIKQFQLAKIGIKISNWNREGLLKSIILRVYSGM